VENLQKDMQECLGNIQLKRRTRTRSSDSFAINNPNPKYRIIESNQTIPITISIISKIDSPCTAFIDFSFPYRLDSVLVLL